MSEEIIGKVRELKKKVQPPPKVRNRGRGPVRQLQLSCDRSFAWESQAKVCQHCNPAVDQLCPLHHCAVDVVHHRQHQYKRRQHGQQQQQQAEDGQRPTPGQVPVGGPTA